jgi:AcrR family transcriptional regulator
MPILEEQPIVLSRKRPTQPRSRATFEAVLSAAAHILKTDGLAGFNTNAVAEKAGVSIGSLYQYFPSKHAILLALMERWMEAFTQEMTATIDAMPGESVAEDIKLLLRKGLSGYLRQPALSQALEAEFAKLRGAVNQASFHATTQAAVVRLLARHRQAIQIDDLTLAAQETGVIAQALMANAAQRGEKDWEQVVERTSRAILGYLGVAGEGARAETAA